MRMLRMASILSMSIAFAAQAPTGNSEKAAEKQPPVVLRVENANAKDAATVRLKNRIVVDVANLDSWVTKPEDLNEIILFLDYRPLPSVKAALTGPSAQSVRRLAFDLVPDYQKESESWRQVLISARRSTDGSVPLSMGLSGKEPLASNVRLLLNVKPWYDWLVYVALGLLAISTVWLARNSDLLRDVPPVPVAGGKKCTYSLARTQMAIWFLLVLTGWCYISLLTDSAAQLSNGILALIGISGATGLAAVAVDSNKWTSAVERRRALVTERDGIIERLDGTPAQPGLRQQVQAGQAAAAAAVARAQGASSGGTATQMAPAPVPSNLADMERELQEKEARLAALQAELKHNPALTAAPSQGWFFDILSDDCGISFHRLQIFTWTIALGGYFTITVFRDLLFPELDNQLLILMGVSSGTYLGFKLPEKPTS